MGANRRPKSIRKRRRNEDGKKTFLGASWVDFGSFWEGVGRPFSLIFYWFFYYFKENDVFEKDRCPRAILEPSGTQKGPKRHPKREPKRTQKRTQNDVNILIDFCSKKSGGARREHGGTATEADPIGDLSVDLDQVLVEVHPGEVTNVIPTRLPARLRRGGAAGSAS